MHHTWRVFVLLVYIWRISDNACSPSNEDRLEPTHLSELVWDSRIGCQIVPVAPNWITTAPIVLPYQSSEIPVTPKAGQNALLRSDSHLKLTLQSLHSAHSHTHLVYQRVWVTRKQSGFGPQEQFWFGSSTVQTSYPLRLGGPDPGSYLSTHRFCRVRLELSVPISGSVLRAFQFIVAFRYPTGNHEILTSVRHCPFRMNRLPL